jgi:hypothetical protein
VSRTKRQSRKPPMCTAGYDDRRRSCLILRGNMSDTHPLVEQLDASLRNLIPVQPVTFAGEWSKALRRGYASEAQLGSGTGPFVDIIDLHWRAAASVMRIGVIVFLGWQDHLYWAKAPVVSLT